jgi:hypothetical protein
MADEPKQVVIRVGAKEDLNACLQEAETRVDFPIFSSGRVKSQRGSGIITVQMLEEFPWVSPKILISPTRPQHKRLPNNPVLQNIPAYSSSSRIFGIWTLRAPSATKPFVLLIQGFENRPAGRIHRSIHRTHDFRLHYI